MGVCLMQSNSVNSGQIGNSPTLSKAVEPDGNVSLNVSLGLNTNGVEPTKENRNRKPSPIKSSQSSLGSEITPLRLPYISLFEDDQCTPITREADRHAYNVSKNMDFSSDELMFLSSRAYFIQAHRLP